MNKRSVIIVLAAIGGLAVLFTIAIAGAVLTYSVLRARPAQAFASIQPQVDPQSGVLVSSVDRTGPAAEAGIVRGDILLEFNGRTLESVQDLRAELAAIEAGGPVDVRVLHGDEQRGLSVTVGERDGQAYLGLTPCGPDRGPMIPQMPAAPGAVIVAVVPDGPADKAGLQIEDRILSVNGEEITPENDLAAIIGSFAPDDTVSLEIARPGEADTIMLEATLGEHPEDAGRAYLGVQYASPDLRFGPGGEMPFRQPFDGHPEIPGMPFEFHHGDQFPVLPDNFQGGIMIGEVAEGSPAEQAGLRSGQIIVGINGESVSRAGALVAVIGSASPGDEVALSVYDPESDQSQDITVTLGESPNEDGKAYLGIQIQGIMLRQERERNPDNPDSSGFFDRLPFRNLPFFDRVFEFDFRSPQDLIPDGEAL